jgi:hypothetical protein
MEDEFKMKISPGSRVLYKLFIAELYFVFMSITTLVGIPLLSMECSIASKTARSCIASRTELCLSACSADFS